MSKDLTTEQEFDEMLANAKPSPCTENLIYDSCGWVKCGFWAQTCFKIKILLNHGYWTKSVLLKFTEG